MCTAKDPSLNSEIISGVPGWLRVGALVTFETYGEHGFPRYHFAVDRAPRGGNGEYSGDGVVESVDAQRSVAYVRFTIWPEGKDKKTGLYDGEPECTLWRWPLPGHPEYRCDQWSRPGYLSRAF
jgi:hypothetical protein